MSSESGVTMCPMIYGSAKATLRLQKEMSSTTVTLKNFIEQLAERFNIREIAFDRWGAVQMVQNLEGMGFTVVPFGQIFKDMSPPTKRAHETDAGAKAGSRRSSGTSLDDG